MPFYFHPNDYTGNDQFTKILLHMDGANGATTFPDTNAGGVANTWSATSATVSTVQKEFGNASMLAATGGVSAPSNSSFTIGSSDWTVDFWLNRNGVSGTMGLFGQGNSTLTSTSVAAGFTGANTFTISINGVVSFTSADTLTGSAQHHIAYVGHSGVAKLYIDGTADANTGTYSSITNPGSSFWVGGRGDFSGAKYTGYLDEFRFSVGIARWTSNFTPPVQPYGPN